MTPLGGIEATTASWTIGGQDDGCVLYQSARRVSQLDLWFSLRLGRRGRAGRASPRLSPARGAPDAVPRSGVALFQQMPLLAARNWEAWWCRSWTRQGHIPPRCMTTYRMYD